MRILGPPGPAPQHATEGTGQPATAVLTAGSRSERSASSRPRPGPEDQGPQRRPNPHPLPRTATAKPLRFRTAPPAGSTAIGEGGLTSLPDQPIREAGARLVAKTDGRPDPAQGRGACAAARRPLIGARQVRRPRPGRRVAPGQTQSWRLRDDKAAAAPIAVSLI